VIYGFVEEQSPRVKAMAIVRPPAIAVERPAPPMSAEPHLPILRLVAIVAAIFLFGAAKPLIAAAKALETSVHAPIAATLVR